MSTNLQTIMKNRRALRLRGVTAGALHILEAIARQTPKGLTRISVAALGRIVGIGRSTALRHVQRLEELGMVLRVGPAIMICANTMLRIAAEAVAERAAHLKRLFLNKKSKSVRTRQLHRTIKISTRLQGYSGKPEIVREIQIPIEDTPMGRQKALRELAETYIPLHLRKNR